ncbi:MAG: ATP phosphoribosyltransferase regulatory subunit [Beijerinckiaceae bacterium]
MTAPVPQPFAAGRQRQETLIAHLTAAGYVRCEPPILQPASAFFDSGEDMRGRLYLTSDMSGADYCLRPEYTIPVCLQYLASGEAGRAAKFSYCGPVFRFVRDGPGEFIQAGIESLGDPNREAADAEVLAISLDAARAYGAGHLVTRIGDAGLLTDLLDALPLAPQWRRRIRRGLGQGKTLDAILDTAPSSGTGHDHSGVLAALEGVDKQGARALVEDLLSIAGITAVGGRSAGEIADRFLEQAALKGGSGLSPETRAVLERFLAAEASPEQAVDKLETLANEAKLDLGGALARFRERNNFFAALGIDLERLSYVPGFVSSLDYYSGFIFETHDTARATDPALIRGGRYDRLLTALGAKTDIPAVGAALWADWRAAASGEQP